MSACRQRWIFLRVSFVRCACADEWIDIAWWSPSPGIVWHCEVRDGLAIGDEDDKYVVLSGWNCDYLFRVGCEKHV